MTQKELNWIHAIKEGSDDARAQASKDIYLFFRKKGIEFVNKNCGIKGEERARKVYSSALARILRHRLANLKKEISLNDYFFKEDSCKKIFQQVGTRTWIEELKSGDTKAIQIARDELYNFYLSDSIGFLISQGLKDPEEAKSIYGLGISDFLTKGVHQFRSESKLQTYLNTICVRIFYKSLEKSKKLPQTVVIKDDLLAEEDEGISQQELDYIGKEKIRKTVLTKMKERCIEILRKRYLVGAKVKEIAKEEAVPEYKIKKESMHCRNELISLIGKFPELQSFMREYSNSVNFLFGPG